MSYIIALDAGTTSIRAFAFDLKANRFVHRAVQETANRYPHPGWVEQDAEEIYYKTAYVLNDCLRFAGDGAIGIGVTNQRETVMAWNRETGDPVSPAIIWQCRRTSDFCARIPKEVASSIREKTGLLPDAYFSASKIRWILDNLPEAEKLRREGKLCVGTVDTFLIFKLTGGKKFVTDYTNASRTMLFNIHTLDWDEELLNYFGVPREILPEALPSDSRMGDASLFRNIPIAGVLGDQQSALLAQTSCERGTCKATYGTGLFLLCPTGKKAVASRSGLLTTVALSANGETHYALEGSVFHAGSSVQWLRDELGLISSAEESERLSRLVPDTGGVVFVPAFTGLGAPYWDPDARGMLTGITRGTRKEHVVRAVLESVACSARELSDCMAKDSKTPMTSLRCDGGASANNFLMQEQADILGIPVDRPVERESTALGAVQICQISLGLADMGTIGAMRISEKVFFPSPDRARFEGDFERYLKAVRRCLSAR